MNILNELDQLVTFPKTVRMPNLLVVGRPANGKTSILHHFAKRYPVQKAEDGSAIYPIMSVEMPVTPDETEFWSTLLWDLGISHRERDSAAIKKRQVQQAMAYAHVRLLVIDEFNNLSSKAQAARDILGAIKWLSNELKICIVAAGTETSINALSTDPQMMSRFEPLVLERWKLDKEYVRFLTSFERLLPLAEPSQLWSQALATKLYGMGGDSIGNTVKILKKAAVRAIETSTERITIQVLDSLGWVAPDAWAAEQRRI